MSEPLILGQIMRLKKENILDEKGQPLHRYFHTTWNFVTPPYIKVPFYLDNWDPVQKVFLITVLHDKTPMEVTIDYPAVPITEEQAQALVDQRKGSGAKPSKNFMSNETNKTAPETAAPGTESGSPASPTPKKERTPRQPKDGRPSIRSLIIKGLNQNHENKTIIAFVQETYPERSGPSIRNLIGVTKYALKGKPKAGEAAAE